VVHSHPILAFFDSGTPDYLISGISSAAHTILIYIYGHSIRISTEREDQYRKWGSHHIYNKADCVTTQGVSV